MRLAIGLTLGLVACGGLGPCTAQPDVPLLSMVDHLGRTHDLGGDSPSTAVLFVAHGVGCPIVRKSTPTLTALRSAYGDEVQLLLVNANPHDSPEAVAEEAAEFGLALPILLDSTQELVRALGFTRTAEAAVVETDSWQVRYHGALDDRLEYGMEKPAANRHYARDALDAVLAGTPVVVPRTRAKGCAIPLQ